VSDLKDIIDVLSTKELSRRQFLKLTGGSFLGMLGVFRVLQSLNTPEQRLATSHREVFGEREYGHPSEEEIKQAKKLQPKSFDEDVFG
jgi:hypothetical protein